MTTLKRHAYVADMVSVTVLVVMATTLLATSTNGIEWLGLYRYHGYHHWNRTADCRLDSTTSSGLLSHQNDVMRLSMMSVGGSGRRRSSKSGGMTFVRDQRRMCQRSLELMPAIVHAARTAIDVCQMQFHDARWNCSSVLSAPQLTADLTSGSREQAFVVALAAASLSQAIAKSCSSGMTTKCGCAGPSQATQLTSQAAGTTRTTASPHISRTLTTLRPYYSIPVPPSGDVRGVPQRQSDGAGHPVPSSTGSQQQYQWGGCGDDVTYGLEFGQKFGSAKWIRRTPSLKSLSNLHNQKVGRKLLAESLVTACKCHGVSGSCALKTCWRALPDMHVVGNNIMRAYHESVVEVTSLPAAGGKRPMSLLSVRTGKEVADDQLSFHNLSPDYCLPDPLVGSIGTQGRECLKDHPGSAGCRSMCCGRRYTTETVTVRYRCDCKYHWCCYVKCRICSEQVEVHRCT